MSGQKQPDSSAAELRIRSLLIDNGTVQAYLEADAVLELLAAPAERLTFVHAAAHDLENAQNPLGWRAGRVAEWLAAVPRADVDAPDLARRTQELMALGFRNFDAFHVAYAELAHAEVFATTDDRLLALGTRHAGLLGVRVVDVVTLVREIFR